MQQETAETIARATRAEAERQARDDLDQLRRQAVEAGRERSCKIIKVTTLNTADGTISYNPAGRLLRDWYLHVYINSLRTSLGQPSESIDSRQSDEAAALLGLVRPDLAPRQAQQVVSSAKQLAAADASSAVARILERLHEAGTNRGVQHAPDERFDGDKLRVQAVRRWYRRCYASSNMWAVRTSGPSASVTNDEIMQVARALVSPKPTTQVDPDSGETRSQDQPVRSAQDGRSRRL